MLAPVERRRAVVGEHLPRVALVDRLGELARLAEIGRRGLEPDQVAVRRIGERACDHGLEAVAHVEEALGRALAGDERGVGLVHVARQKPRRESVGAADHDCRDAADVGREPGGDERADVLGGRDEHLAAEVAAFLLGGELVLEVHAGRACLDERLHQLERVQRPAEAGLCVGDDRREPVGAVLPLAVLDLVGAQERVVQAPDERGRAVGRVEALVGVGVPGEVPVGGDLPAGEVDRLQAGLHHLDGLAAGQRAECGNARLGLEEVPEPLGAEAREGVLDLHGTAQPVDVRGGVGAFDSVPAVNPSGRNALRMDRASVTVRAHPGLLSVIRCRGRARRTPGRCTLRARRSAPPPVLDTNCSDFGSQNGENTG